MTLESQSRIVCNWMSPEPQLPETVKGLAAMPDQWWRFRTLATFSGMSGGALVDVAPILVMCDPIERLGYLAEVETRLQARLNYALLVRYVEALSEAVGNAHLWHATAEQKIAALASVLPGRAE